MQVVIDIDEGIMQGIIEGKGDKPREIVRSFQATIADAIKNGTPLPKGHGRLIDADALECHRQIQIVPRGNGKYTEVTTYYQNDIDVAPTIIEADKEENGKMLICPECGLDVHSDYKKCPRCGAKVRDKE